ncbi:hypothetical protein BWQ96_00300 [Gracilariopsis chorda]|uniref:FAD/NAD(P)-binding domain-containing protein n=1 Tax=Gracilariopsis chorda TaxID=448386 RepID=A0A2V3JDW6_9FLOR|nr:hypothetical protein BWQ96_00300 [Gracilariopsis chorda]|eukprot:PXF50140.1 hypothetical protein BWQ96_00300 [Gracilariopsis chorda]
MTTRKILLLVGGGHSHIQVVKNFTHSTHDTQCMLISNSPVAVYSGMLPAVIAGLIPYEDSLVHLQPLCEAHNFHFIHGTVTQIDPQNKRVYFNAPQSSIQFTLHYDVLSIDVGSRTRDVNDVSQPTMTNAKTQLPLIVRTRPILHLEDSISEYESLAKEASLPCARVVVIGAGAAGVELALALEARLKRSLDETVVRIVSQHDTLVSQFGRMSGAAVAAECRRRGIQMHIGQPVISVKDGVVRLKDGTEFTYDMAVIATGAAAHDWVRRTGLVTDEDGWLVVERTLQCKGFADVFAAGDCISFGGAFGKQFPPKAGVYAVREGPTLTHNLQKVLGNRGTLMEFTPQASFLSLLSTGDGRGIGTKHGLAFKGTWVYRLKNFIDERWQERFRVSWGTDGRVEDGQEDVDGQFDGTAAEGAALLLCSEDLNQSDSFEKQLSVLRRMDCDDDFREELLKCVQST